VNFQTAIEICIKKKYADFSGRASRSEFWFFYLFILIGSILTIIADVNMFSHSFDAWGPVNSIYQLLVIVPSLAVSARRLHDTNKSGWYILFSIIPIFGLIVIFWWSSLGSNKKNRFGNPIKLKRKR
tara:strand:- start:71 stop:451 length:381 start_codon:yes stop_codon:yes gene_type:complete